MPQKAARRDTILPLPDRLRWPPRMPQKLGFGRGRRVRNSLMTICGQVEPRRCRVDNIYVPSCMISFIQPDFSCHTFPFYHFDDDILGSASDANNPRNWCPTDRKRHYESPRIFRNKIGNPGVLDQEVFLASGWIPLSSQSVAIGQLRQSHEFRRPYARWPSNIEGPDEGRFVAQCVQQVRRIHRPFGMPSR